MSETEAETGEITEPAEPELSGSCQAAILLMAVSYTHLTLPTKA